MLEISASQVAGYLGCRRRWYWAKQWEPVRTATPVALWFGKTSHRAFELALAGEVSPQEAWRQAMTEEADTFPGTPEAQDAAKLGPNLLDYLLRYLKTYMGHLRFRRHEVPFRFNLTEVRGTPVVFSGRFDAIAEDTAEGGVYVVDLKFMSQFQGGWDRSPQMTAYYWAAQKYYGNALQGVLVIQVKKKLPDPPARLLDGGMSVNRMQRTSYLVASQLAKEIYGDDVPLNVREYLRWLREQQDPTVRTDFLWRSQGQLRTWEAYMRQIAQEMLDPTLALYPNPGWHCATCVFSAPCLALDDDEPDVARELLETQFRRVDASEGDAL